MSAMTDTTSPGPARNRWLPEWAGLVDGESIRADALAGVLGALLVLPQGIAFATLAGLPPQYGLYGAIVPGIVAALFGSSRHVVSGPTNANSLALFAMLAPLAVAGSPAYVELALAVTVLVGVLQTATAVLRLGAIANFISPTALQGFTSGAAALIGFHATKDFLGLKVSPGDRTIDLLHQVAQGSLPVNTGAVAVGLATLVVTVALRHWRRRWPFMLIGLVAGSALGVTLEGTAWQVRELGLLPSPLPPFHVPDVPVSRLPELVGIAAALTVVALAQSISIAKAIAARSGQRIHPNREFLGQGLSNIVGGFFSCYVSCGSLNRSVPNLEAGARTPLSGVFASLSLVPMLALSAPLLAHIAYPAIAGLLMMVAWTLFDVPRWKQLWRSSRTEFAVAAITLAATLTLPLEIAVLIGSALSLGLFLQRSSRPAMRTMGFDRGTHDRRFVVRDETPGALPECPQLKLLRMEGSVYFGATAHVSDHLQELHDASQPQKHLLVMGKSMNFVDVAGSDLWRTELRARRAAGGDLYFHRPRPAVMAQWKQDGFLTELGADHVYPDKFTAIADIRARHLDPAICAACKVRVFWECQEGSPVI